MKCIQCGTDNNYQDRRKFLSKCKNCGHQFVFEPKNMMNKITDPQFAKILNDISVRNSLFYNPKQFTYYLDNILKPRPVYILYLLIFLYCFFSYLFFYFWPIYHLIVILVLYAKGYSNKTLKKERHKYGKALQIAGYIGIFIGSLIVVVFAINIVANDKSNVRNQMISILFILFLAMINIIIEIIAITSGRKIIKSKNPGVQTFLFQPSQIENWLIKWQTVNGKIENILLPPSEQNLTPRIEFDIEDYSFDKLLVCETTEIAQFLIANNFHFENNCAVLSITGYPENIFDTILEMVKPNPKLKVYALHDCTPKGIGLVDHLRTSENWFAGYDIAIYNIGLLPRHVLETSNTFVEKSAEFKKQAKKISPKVRQSLSQEEIEWLESGLFVELESFTPKKLLRVVSQSIKETRRLEKTSINYQENDQERENWKVIRDDGEFAVSSRYDSTINITSDSFG